jgi:hypothetical protein
MNIGIHATLLKLIRVLRQLPTAQILLMKLALNQTAYTCRLHTPCAHRPRYRQTVQCIHSFLKQETAIEVNEVYAPYHSPVHLAKSQDSVNFTTLLGAGHDAKPADCQTSTVHVTSKMELDLIVGWMQRRLK